MIRKPKILITNDDGIESPGIFQLACALAPFANVTIVAPREEQSGVGCAITMRSPLQFEEVSWQDGVKAFRVDGTPVDCVRLGISQILQEPPDLIVSGINRGDNSGCTIFYSGTVGGVIEGSMKGIPGIAFSYSVYEKPNFAPLQEHVAFVVQHVLNHPLPSGAFLNVNFPAGPQFKGLRFARQGRGYWAENPVERSHPEGRNYYWMGGRWSGHEEHPESDVALLREGYIAAVPILVHDMTHYDLLEERKRLLPAHAMLKSVET